MLRLLCILSVLVLINGQLIRVPLQKKPNSKITYEKILADREFVRGRYASMLVGESGSAKDVTIQYRPGYSLVYGTISVGTPPQPITVVFDTSSPTNWVYGASFQSTNGFNSTASTSYDALASFYQYTDGEVESIDIYHVANMAVQNQFFEIYNYAVAGSSIDYDGSVGLSIVLNTASPFKPLMENIMEQHLLSNAIFSMYLNNVNGNLEGEILFGGSDANLYTGSLKYFNSSSDYANYWTIPIDSLVMNGKTIEQNVIAVVDSGANYIYVTPKALVEINIMIKSTLNANQESVVDCSTIDQLPAVSFNIGGMSFSIPVNLYIEKIETNGATQCISLFSINANDATEYVFGQLFFLGAYAEFDLSKKQIGLAKLNKISGDSSSDSSNESA